MLLRNKLKQILAEGKVAFGATIQIPATALVEIMGRVGFDYVMIDTEHGMYDLQMAGELIRAAQGAGLTPLVRVLRNEKELIMKALDLGAEGVVVPHVSTPEDAVCAVAACHYGPGGQRGVCPLVRAASYGLGDWPHYEEAANQSTMVILSVEDLEGAENIEKIVAVEGVDGILLGLFDMSVSAGCGGDVSHPKIRKAADKILTVCQEKVVITMHSMTNGRDLDTWVRRGVRMVLASADSFLFAQACKAFLDSVSSLRGKSRGVLE